MLADVAVNVPHALPQHVQLLDHAGGFLQPVQRLNRGSQHVRSEQNRIQRQFPRGGTAVQPQPAAVPRDQLVPRGGKGLNGRSDLCEREKQWKRWNRGGRR